MIAFFFLACAIKDGIEVVKIQHEYRAHAADIPLGEMTFEQSMATLYIQKSWEEYANAQYQDSLVLAKKSREWLAKSQAAQKESAKTASETEPVKDSNTSPAPEKETPKEKAPSEDAKSEPMKSEEKAPAPKDDQ